jgi:amino-acid N-acetyltransferase
MEIFTHPTESAVKRLLVASGLPTSDLTQHHLAHFFGCGSNDELVGVVGIEPCGDAALLRSLAVAAHHRGAGLGLALVARAERHAEDLGIKSLYLLTTTAEDFFRRLGYVRIPRAQAPPGIKSTQEFAGICPVSSAFMVKHLDPIYNESGFYPP